MPTSYQMQMFPRKTLIEYPKSKNTADYIGEAEVDDGFRYFLKTDSNSRPIRASEWLSTHIAEAVGIPAPPAAVIMRQDSSIVFGSRKVSGVSDEVITATYLVTPSLSNTAAPPIGLQALTSSIYAFDMFIHNDDRHLGNYLSVDDSGIRRLYAFDYSRALFWNWPWSSWPDAKSHTRMLGILLRQMHGFDVVAANSVLDRLNALAPNTIQGFINQMPSDWIPDQLRDQLMTYWSDGSKDHRVNAIRKGFQDGSLL